MKYDSLYVISDNGHRRKIEFVTKGRRNKNNKKLKKPKNQGFVIGEVGTGMNFQLKNQLMHNMIHSGRPVMTTFHASSSLGEDEIQKLSELYHLRVEKVPKNKRLNHKRMLKYRDARVRLNRFRAKDISTSTIRNLKKYLSPYGNFSIKSEIYIFDETRVVLTAYDENVFKHLYLLDSTSDNYISVADYIVISMMGNGTEMFINGKQVVKFNDTLGEYEIAIEKGNYNKLYLTDGIKI